MPNKLTGKAGSSMSALSHNLIVSVDISATMIEEARRRTEGSGLPAEFTVGDAHALPFDDARFDSALSTMTLCTIPDGEAALHEIRRVLKPGARFHFAEHGHAPDAKVARMQDRLNRMQNKVAGGCNLNREVDTLLTKAGFEIETMRNFYMKGPKPFGYMYVGVARVPA